MHLYGQLLLLLQSEQPTEKNVPLDLLQLLSFPPLFLPCSPGFGGEVSVHQLFRPSVYVSTWDVLSELVTQRMLFVCPCDPLSAGLWGQSWR